MGSGWLVIFAVVSGYTASGIVASLYRLSGIDAESRHGRIVRQAALIVAGPTVLLETAYRGYAKKEWSLLMFWFAVMGLSYWSFAIGLLVIDFAIRF